jgi:carboxypeptidase Taq
MEETFDALLSRMRELGDLGGLIGLATWDQETYLPPKAADSRAHQLSTLQGIHHERLVDPGWASWPGRPRTRAYVFDAAAG